MALLAYTKSCVATMVSLGGCSHCVIIFYFKEILLKKTCANCTTNRNLYESNNDTLEIQNIRRPTSVYVASSLSPLQVVSVNRRV